MNRNIFIFNLVLRNIFEFQLKNKFSMKIFSKSHAIRVVSCWHEPKSRIGCKPSHEKNCIEISQAWVLQCQDCKKLCVWGLKWRISNSCRVCINVSGFTYNIRIKHSYHRVLKVCYYISSNAGWIESLSI